MALINTTQLGERLGMYLTVNQIIGLTGVEGERINPLNGRAYLWKEEQIGEIARRLAEHFSRIVAVAPRDEQQRIYADKLEHYLKRRSEELSSLTPLMNLTT